MLLSTKGRCALAGVVSLLAFGQFNSLAAEAQSKEFFVDTETGMRLLVAARIPTANRLGKAVLLVHGSGVGWEYWDVPFRDYSVMNYLAKRGLDVYAVQNRGYGKSTKPNGMTVTAANMADDLKSVVADIMKRSGVSKVSMAGHSSGGTVALVAGGRYPELLDRMVIIGTRYKRINPNFVAYATKMIEQAKEPGKDYVNNTHYLDVEKRLDAHDEDVVAWYKKLVGDNYRLMPGGIYPDSVGQNPGRPYVPAMKVPTLILNGSKEYVVELSDGFDMLAELGTGDKAAIIQPGGYHLMFLERKGHVGIQESIYFWVTRN